jgi:phenylacetate-CoA ligase
MLTRVEPPPREAAEQVSAAELHALQLSRMRTTLDRAYAGNAHYRAAFDAAGVRPEDLRALSDLARFPFTGKHDLRANYPFGFFCAPMPEIARIHASSGTTGQPTVVGYTRADLATWSELVARCLRVAGVRPGMRVHVAYGYGLFTRLHGDPDVRRADRTAGPADPGLPTGGHPGDAQLHAGHPRRVPPAGP